MEAYELLQYLKPSLIQWIKFTLALDMLYVNNMIKIVYLPRLS
jgi:hypothetical protein